MGLDLELMAIKIDESGLPFKGPTLDIYFKTTTEETGRYSFLLSNLEWPGRIIVIDPYDEDVCKLIDVDKKRKESGAEMLSKISEALRFNNYETIKGSE